MACTTCISDCQCSVVAGNSAVTVTGTGAGSDPYRVYVDVCQYLGTLTNSGRNAITTDRALVRNASGICELVVIPSAAGSNSFTAAGNAGSSQTITMGDTLTVRGAAGSNITVTALSTDTLSIDYDLCADLNLFPHVDVCDLPAGTTSLFGADSTGACVAIDVACVKPRYRLVQSTGGGGTPGAAVSGGGGVTDPELLALAGLTSAADTVPYFTGSGTAALTPLTATARTLLDDTSTSAMRTTLGLGTVATQAASAVAITGGTITGITDLAVADGGTGAGTASGARTNLGLVIGTDVQAFDSDLSTIAGLTATTDNFIQSKASAWSSRTPTQVTADLIAMVGDSGSGGTKGLVPAPAAGDTAANKFLKANGTWTAIGAGTGDVTGQASSVDSEIALFSGTTGKIIKRATNTGLLKASSGVIATATAGTDYYNPGGTDVAVADGGTGASTAAAARTNLGLVIGTDVQAQDAELAAIAGLTSAADRLPYFTGSGTAALATFSAFARTFIDDADAASVLATLGLSYGQWWRCSTNTTSSAVTYADITGLTGMPVAASTMYRFTALMSVAISSAVGVQFRINPTTTAIASSIVMGDFPTSGNSGVDSFYETAVDVTGIGPSPGTNPGANVVHLVKIDGTFTTNATPGTIALQGRISSITGSGTATFDTNSRFRLEKIITVN